MERKHCDPDELKKFTINIHPVVAVACCSTYTRQHQFPLIIKINLRKSFSGLVLHSAGPYTKQNRKTFGVEYFCRTFIRVPLVFFLYLYFSLYLPIYVYSFWTHAILNEFQNCLTLQQTKRLHNAHILYTERSTWVILRILH